MKRIILLLAAGGCFFLSCGTAHKVVKKTVSGFDSLHVRGHDSLNLSRRDSLSAKYDKSVIITNEHIVNDLSVPGANLINSASLAQLLAGGKRVLSPDSLDTLDLSYNSVDGSVKATLLRRAQKLHQVIDRTISNYRNTADSIKVVNVAKVKVSDTSADHHSAISSDTEKDTEYNGNTFSRWLAIGLVLGAVALVWLKIKK